MKKLFILALALIMVLSLAACGSKADPAPSGTADLSVLLDATSSDGWEVAVSNDEIRVIKP